jgi:outer membrane protein
MQLPHENNYGSAIFCNRRGGFVSAINIFRVAAIALACLLGTIALRSQTATPPASAGKIGVVNIQGAIDSTAEGKQAAGDLQAQFAPREQELESLNKQVDDLQKRLNGATLTDTERGRLTAQGTRLAQRLERKNTEYQEDFNAARGEVVNQIGRKMIDTLNRYAQDGNFTVILDSSSQNSPILFAAKTADITPEVIRLYNEAHPAKAATTAPSAKPSAPKPQ